jgi:hypothetical protein
MLFRLFAYASSHTTGRGWFEAADYLSAHDADAERFILNTLQYDFPLLTPRCIICLRFLTIASIVVMFRASRCVRVCVCECGKQSARCKKKKGKEKR